MLININTLFWTEKIIIFALFFQSIEFLLLKESYNNKGVWQWELIKKEYYIFPKFSQFFLNFCLSYPNFLYLLILRIIICALGIVFPSVLVIYFLLLSQILICLRWRGTFNGGSDYMSLIILTALALFWTFPSNETVQLLAIFYIAIQSLSSYFVAGVVKIKNVKWRTGKALKTFFNCTIFDDNNLTKLFKDNNFLLFSASWSIMLFELAAPIIFFSPNFCLSYISLAFVFHLANFYFFGLNRFIFSWLATYPALYYCSHLFHL